MKLWHWSFLGNELTQKSGKSEEKNDEVNLLHSV